MSKHHQATISQSSRQKQAQSNSHGASKESLGHGVSGSKQNHANEPTLSAKEQNQQFSNVPSFLLKTYDIVNDPQYDNIICWNETEDGFIVKQPNEFAEKILPKFFKHNNFSSFVRQLNMYDFHKTRNNSNEHCFSHNLFKKSQKKLLVDIKRKNAVPQAEKMNPQFSQNQQNPSSSLQMQQQYGKYTNNGLGQINNMNMIDQQQSAYDDDQLINIQGGDMPQISQAYGGQVNMQMIKENYDSIKSFMIKMEQKMTQYEEKCRMYDQKLKEYDQLNQSLWNEIKISKDREQSLDKLFFVAFSCMAQANGYNMGGPRELMNQQYVPPVPGQSNGIPHNQSNNSGVRNSLGPNGASGGGLGHSNNNNSSIKTEPGLNNSSTESLVLRQESSSDLMNLLQRLVLQNPGLISQFLQLISGQGVHKNQGNPADVYQMNGNVLGQNGQSNSGIQMIDQLLKVLTNANQHNAKQNLQHLFNQYDNDNLSTFSQQANPNQSATRGFNGNQLNNFGQTSRPGFQNNQSTYQKHNFPQLKNQSMISNSPPGLSPNPYAFDEYEKNSFKNLFQRTTSEYSFDHSNLTHNQKIHVPQPHRISRTNSMAGSIAASDDASLFIARDHVLSEADSDDQRKRMSNELRKAFDSYMNSANQNNHGITHGQGNLQPGTGNNQGSSMNRQLSSGNIEYASNHNVEFETISNSSGGTKAKLPSGSVNGSAMSSAEVKSTSLVSNNTTTLKGDANVSHSSSSLLGKRRAGIATDRDSLSVKEEMHDLGSVQEDPEINLNNFGSSSILRSSKRRR